MPVEQTTRSDSALQVSFPRNMRGELLNALYQYRDDLLYPPGTESVDRRMAMIDALALKLGQAQEHPDALALLAEVIRPYGLYDTAVSSVSKSRPGDLPGFLNTGRMIRAAIAKNTEAREIFPRPQAELAEEIEGGAS